MIESGREKEEEKKKRQRFKDNHTSKKWRKTKTDRQTDRQRIMLKNNRKNK